MAQVFCAPATGDVFGGEHWGAYFEGNDGEYQFTAAPTRPSGSFPIVDAQDCNPGYTVVDGGSFKRRLEALGDHLDGIAAKWEDSEGAWADRNAEQFDAVRDCMQFALECGEIEAIEKDDEEVEDENLADEAEQLVADFFKRSFPAGDAVYEVANGSGDGVEWLGTALKLDSDINAFVDAHGRDDLTCAFDAAVSRMIIQDSERADA